MNEYTCRRKKWNQVKEEDTLQSFGLAEMEFTLDEKVQKEITKYMKDSVMGYSQAPESYYETIGNWMRTNYNEHIKNEDIVVTAGVVPAIKAFIELRTSSQGKVLILAPSYNNFYKAIHDTERGVESVELDYDQGQYSIDFERLEASLKKEDVEMMIICQPHNPIGRLFTHDELEKIINLCRENDVFIVSDEIHGDLIFDDAEFISLLDFDLSIPVCTSGSKTFNIAGFKTSNIIITDKQLQDEFYTYIEKHDLCGNSAVGLFGTEKSYELSADWLKDKLAIIQDNVKLVKEYLKDTHVIITEQNSTFLMWLNFNYYLEKNPKFFECLEDHGIYFSVGTLYGPEGKGFARVNVATELKYVKEMLEELVKVLDENN